MPKAEISWKRSTPDGLTLQCYAQHVGKEWIFHQREKRFDNWQLVKEPPLGDWLALLDSVRRRINRRLLPPKVEQRLLQAIKERFPSAQL
jgi:hypothetical protein